LRVPRFAGPRLIATLAGALLLVAKAARADDQAELEKARNAYVARQFDEAEHRLLAILDPDRGTHDPTMLTQARMYWGAVMFAKGNVGGASAVFEKLILDDPTYEPDPISFPTKVVEVFIDTRAQLRERLEKEALERARKEAERRAREAEAKRREALRLAMLERMAGEEKVTEVHSRWLALVPFGAGQFQNADRTLGWVFLSAESALVLGSLVTLPIYLTDLQYRTEAHSQGDDFRANEYIDRANTVRTVNLIMVGALGVTAVAGVVQAQLNFVPTIVRVRPRPVPEVGAVGWLTPVLAPTAEGRGAVVGLGGRF
jgi:hypothetical protein